MSLIHIKAGNTQQNSTVMDKKTHPIGLSITPASSEKAVQPREGASTQQFIQVWTEEQIDVHQIEQKKHPKQRLLTHIISSLWTEETIKQCCILRAESDLPHVIVFYRNYIKTWLQINLIRKLLVLIHTPCPFSSSSSMSCLYINHSSPDLYTQVSSPNCHKTGWWSAIFILSMGMTKRHYPQVGR